MCKLVDALHKIQENCRYERKVSSDSSFHCYDVTGCYFDMRVVKQAEELEQRYEQIEQIAKEMYQVIDEAMNREQYVCNLGDVERMKSSLEALGVEV